MIKASAVLCAAVCITFALEIDNQQTTIIASPADWNSTEQVSFSGDTTKAYNCDDGYCLWLFRQGLQFTGGGSYDLRNTLTGGHHGMKLGARGSGTEVHFNGKLRGDGGGAFIDLYLKNGAKIIVGSEAEIDLVMNSSLYTRQMWVASEGGGIFETEEGYEANRGEGDASGSYRFHNTTFISHHTRNLPVNDMESCADCPDGFEGVNGHLVFESQGGSRWIVATNDQEYPAAIWIWVDVTIETRKDLTHTGRYVVLRPKDNRDYNLAGAFQTLASGVTITKEGPADLILAGGQAYKSGAHMDIRAGGVVFRSDAVGGVFRPGNQGTGGRDLAVTVAGGARAAFLHDGVRLASLSLADDATVEVALGGASDFDFDANGTLLITNALGRGAQAGESFTIFKTIPAGEFDNVETPAQGSWDLSKLYTDGTVTLLSGSVGVSRDDFAVAGADAVRVRDWRVRSTARLAPGDIAVIRDIAGRERGRLRIGRAGMIDTRSLAPAAVHLFAAPAP